MGPETRPTTGPMSVLVRESHQLPSLWRRPSDVRNDVAPGYHPSRRKFLAHGEGDSRWRGGLANQEHAAVTRVALWCVGLDRYLPAGRREHLVDFLGREPCEPGLPEGRDHQPAQTMSKALHASAVLRGHRGRRGKPTAGRGERTEVGQDTFGRRAREVAQEAFDEEQRRAGLVVSDAPEGSDEAVAVEVDRHERDAVGRRADGGEASAFVGLCGGMVNLEPDHSRSRESQGATVVAGAKNDDLADTALESREARTIEERRAARHPLPPLRAPLPQRTPSQRVVEAKLRVCVAGRELGTVEFRPCERHKPRCRRRLARSHEHASSQNRELPPSSVETGFVESNRHRSSDRVPVVAYGLSLNGRSTVLCGSLLPEHLEELPLGHSWDQSTSATSTLPTMSLLTVCAIGRSGGRGMKTASSSTSASLPICARRSDRVTTRACSR